MRKITNGVAGVALGLSLMGLVGCGAVAKKAAEKTVEKGIESQTGGKVDVGSNGKVKIQTSDGTYTADSNGINVKTSDGNLAMTTGDNTKLPKDWPSWLDLPSGAKLQSALTTDGRMNISYEISGTTVEKVVSKLDGELTGEGYKSSTSMQSNGGEFRNYTKGPSSVTINVTPTTSGSKTLTGSITYVANDGTSSDTSS